MRHGPVICGWLAGVLCSPAVAEAAMRPVPGARLPPQDKKAQPTFDTRRPPRGTVTDEAGAPIGGATVYFRTARTNIEALRWRNWALRRQPLPRVRTSRDGEFFLPLTQLHRLFTANNAGQFTLVVEKDGFHPWIEPLASGLRGYLGSRVVLRRVTAKDRFTVEVKNPQPGMMVRVHRFSSQRVSGIDHEQWFAVPESGLVDAAMAFLPTPLSIGAQSSRSVSVGIEVQLIHPGRTTVPKPLSYDQKRIVVGDKVSQSRFVAVLRRRDGQPIAEPRGLYRCPDGVSRWFPVDPENVVESSYLPLYALVAKDCLAANVRYIDPSEETITLDVVGEGRRSLTLRDASGGAVKIAQVYFFDLEWLPAHRDGLKLGGARARRRLTVRDGRVDLSGRILPGPGFLFFVAPGYGPQMKFEPRAITGHSRLTLQPKTDYGTLEVTVVDGEERPLRGVHIALQGSSVDLGAMYRGLPRTDERGVVTMEYVPQGLHTIKLIAPGLTESTTNARIRPGQTVRRRLTLYPTVDHKLLLVDGNGKPVPFRSVRSYAQFQNNPNQIQMRSQVGTNTTATSDSLGRILLSGLPAGVIPRVTEILSAGNIQLSESDGIQRVAVSSVETVVMPLPDAPVVRESLVSPARKSTRSVVAREGCGAVIVQFPRSQVGTCISLYMRGKPPIRLTEEILENAREKQGPGILFLDQRVESRRVHLDLLGLGEDDLGPARIEIPGMNFRDAKPYLYGDSGLRLEKSEARGTERELWSVGLRDTGSYAARLMHPKFLLEEVDIPGEAEPGASGKPLRVEMERGTEVVFRLKSSTDLKPSYRFNLYVHTELNEMVLYERETLSESGLRKIGKQEWEMSLPFALRPGKYFISLRVYSTNINLPRVLFTIPDEGPFEIHIDKRTALAAQPKITDIKVLSDRIERLKRNTEALKNMKDTDAKSKARLQKVLKEFEVQLETHERELEKLRAIEAERKRQEAIEAAAREAREKRGKQDLKKTGEKRVRRESSSVR